MSLRILLQPYEQLIGDADMQLRFHRSPSQQVRMSRQIPFSSTQ